MGTRIKRPCSHPGCPKLVTTRFCDDHCKVAAADFERDRKDDPIRALYKTARWKATRLNVLFRDPVCKACGKWASEEADHVEPARKIVAEFGEEAFYDESRLQGLCKKCHSKKTAKEVGWAGHNKEN